MKASELSYTHDYPNFPEFERFRIPLEHMDAQFIFDLQQERTFTGIPLYPSPDPAGWVRFNGDPDSRHFAVGRESDAGDLFPERGRFVEFYHGVLQSPRWGGVGIYSDTLGLDGKPWAMIHLDRRPLINGLKTVWARHGAVWGRKGTYYSLNKPGFKDVLREIINMDKAA